MILDDDFGVHPATPTATTHAQVLFQVLDAASALIHRPTDGFVIHSFADANKHSPKRNETQSHVNTVPVFPKEKFEKIQGGEGFN